MSSVAIRDRLTTHLTNDVVSPDMGILETPTVKELEGVRRRPPSLGPIHHPGDPAGDMNDPDSPRPWPSRDAYVNASRTTDFGEVMKRDGYIPVGTLRDTERVAFAKRIRYKIVIIVAALAFDNGALFVGGLGERTLTIAPEDQLNYYKARNGEIFPHFMPCAYVYNWRDVEFDAEYTHANEDGEEDLLEVWAALRKTMTEQFGEEEETDGEE